MILLQMSSEKSAYLTFPARVGSGDDWLQGSSAMASFFLIKKKKCATILVADAILKAALKRNSINRALHKDAIIILQFKMYMPSIRLH
jgi:hypothetical protein